MDVIPQKEKDLSLGEADIKPLGRPGNIGEAKLTDGPEPVAVPEAVDPRVATEEFIGKVKSILEDIGICMVCTLGKGGEIESRPMVLHSVDTDGSLWFFFGRDTLRSEQIQTAPHVTVTASDPKGNKCVELRGPGKIVQSHEQLQPMWKLEHGHWFAGGLDDPQVALFRVDVREAAYWEWKSGLVGTTLKRLEAMVTGVEPPDMVHERKVL